MKVSHTILTLMALTIAILNANELRDNQKRDMIFDYLTRKKIAVTYIQESHSEKSDESSWKKEWGGTYSF